MAIEEMDWSSMTEDYICFTEDFNADAELSESCDDASGISSSNDKDSDDNSLVVILGIVIGVLLVVIAILVIMKRSKVAKAPRGGRHATIGSASFDLRKVHALADHEFYRKWVGLVDFLSKF